MLQQSVSCPTCKHGIDKKLPNEKSDPIEL